MTIPQAAEELRVDQSKTPQIARRPANSRLSHRLVYCWAQDRDMRRGTLPRPCGAAAWSAIEQLAGKPAVLDAQCCHLGAVLGRGRVIGDTIRMSVSQLGDLVPTASASIFRPSTRYRTCPTDQLSRGPAPRAVVCLSGSEPHYELPFFPDCRPEDFTPAQAFPERALVSLVHGRGECV